MESPNPKNQKEYKDWVNNTIKDLYNLEGLELIEKSQDFFAIFSDQYAEAEIKHTQKTNDEEIDKEFSFLRDEIRPLLKIASAKIAEKVIQKNNYPERFKQYIKEAKVTHELFHPEIPELQKQEGKLEAEWYKGHLGEIENIRK